MSFPRPTSNAQRALALIKAAATGGQIITIDELAKMLGLTSRQTHNAVGVLLFSEQVERSGPKTYRLVQPGSPAPPVIRRPSFIRPLTPAELMRGRA